MIVETHREYIGDGIYAGFDGYQIWLRTLEGNQIALEPEVFSALQNYVQRLRDALKPPPRDPAVTDEPKTTDESPEDGKEDE